MRIIDSDILSYALLEDHIATPYARPLVERALKGEVKLYVLPTTLLETYNVLYWYYRVRPRWAVAKKVLAVAEGLTLVQPSERGFYMAVEENVPLGDAILVATALDSNIPVVVLNDRHVRRLAEKYGLIFENPIPEEVRKQMLCPAKIMWMVAQRSGTLGAR